MGNDRLSTKCETQDRRGVIAKRLPHEANEWWSPSISLSVQPWHVAYSERINQKKNTRSLDTHIHGEQSLNAWKKRSVIKFFRLLFQAYLFTTCCCITENFIYKVPKMKLGSCCIARKVTLSHPTSRSIASFSIELAQFCCPLSVASCKKRQAWQKNWSSWEIRMPSPEVLLT